MLHHLPTDGLYEQARLRQIAPAQKHNHLSWHIDIAQDECFMGCATRLARGEVSIECFFPPRIIHDAMPHP